MSAPPCAVIIIGAGGHARVVLDILRLSGHAVIGMLDRAASTLPPQVDACPILGDDRWLNTAPNGVRLALGLGTVGVGTARMALYARLADRGHAFVTAVHPRACVAASADLGAGTVVAAGAIINPGARVGVAAIVNTGAIIDHDCVLEAGAHVAPGAVLSGGVRVGEESLIGVGAVVRQGITIGRRAIVGAGSVVVRDVPDGAVVTGVPAAP